MRAINAAVTSLDCLRSFPNVLLSATNNLTSSVNEAFLDHANRKVYVSLSILEAQYEILKGCLMELLHVGIVGDHHDVFCDFHDVYNMVYEPRPQVHEAFNNCLYRVMCCVSNLQKGFPWRALLRH
jgi:hypothetical protein